MEDEKIIMTLFRLCFYCSHEQVILTIRIDCSNISSVIHTFTSLRSVAGGLKLNELLILGTEYTEWCRWSRHAQAPRFSLYMHKESSVISERTSYSLVNTLCSDRVRSHRWSGIETCPWWIARWFLGMTRHSSNDKEEKTSMSWNLSRPCSAPWKLITNFAILLTKIDGSFWHWARPYLDHLVDR